MSFEAYFRITSYGVVAAAFGALAITGQVDAVSVTLYLMALCLSIYMDVRGYKRFRVREWMWRLLTVIYIPFVFIDAAYVSTKIVALVHMTLFLSAVKLFQDKRDRDWVFLYLIGFFQILLAASLTFNASFIASMIVYIFFFVSTLAAFEIKRARREVAVAGEEEVARLKGIELKPKDASPSRPPRPESQTAMQRKPKRNAGNKSRTRYLLGASIVQLLLVTILTLPLFFLIPRFSGNAISGSFGEIDTVTGFSDTVNLGDVASIKSSSRVVMRVKLDPAPGRWLRWRGVALDHYDGRTWTLSKVKDRDKSMSAVRYVPGVPLGQDDHYLPTYDIDSVDPDENLRVRHDIDDPQYSAPVADSIIKQDFYLEPLNVGTLFAAGELLRIRGPIRALRVVTDTRSVASPHGRILYSAWSNTQRPSEKQLRADSTGEIPGNIEDLYLQLPSKEHGVMRLDPRITRLANEITASASTPYDKAKAIEGYLKTKYGYTLNLRPTSGDPLAEFLFDVREGHCEYFATAMVIMLRTLKIPARIVNGFQMGEYNDINGYYTVRDRDAHSWVEAYFPSVHTWVEFDPTPASGLNDYSHGGIISQIRKYLDAAEVFWLDYVVTLDRDQQAGIMISLQHRLLAMKQVMISYYAALKVWLLGVITYLFLQRRWGPADLLMLILELGLVAAAITAVYVVRSYAKLRNQSSTGYCPWWKRVFILPTWRGGLWIKRDQRRSAVLFYEQMLAILARAKLIKRPDQTPLEFATAQKFVQVSEITEAYNTVRFGDAILNEAESLRIARLLSELKLAVRKI